MNLENKKALEIADITNNTNIVSSKKECKGIGIVWRKKCPKCGGNQIFSNRFNLMKAIKLNRQCRKCMFKSPTYRKKHKINSKKMWTDPEKRISIINRRKLSIDKWRASMAKIYSSAEYRKKMSEAIIKYAKTHPLHYKKIGKCMSNIRKDPNSVFNTEEYRTKLREGLLKQVEKNGVAGNYNPSACKYFDKLNRENGWNLQHALNGGEIRVIGYSLDAYDKKKNIVVEYDEPHHYYLGELRSKDKIRQNRIVNHLKCEFYRYNESLQNLQKQLLVVRKEK